MLLYHTPAEMNDLKLINTPETTYFPSDTAEGIKLIENILLVSTHACRFLKLTSRFPRRAGS